MHKLGLLLIVIALAAAPAAAQSAAPATLPLTVDQAVTMALDHNVDLSAERLNPQISDTQVAAAAGAFKPVFNTGVNRNSQILPPSSLFLPLETHNNIVTSQAGVSQRLPWFGTSLSVGWNAVRTDTNPVFFNLYNPVVQSGLAVNISQPLLRDLSIDSARQQLLTSRIGRDVADTRLRESIVHTTADVKAAYWNLVSAHATVDARQSALDLAEELVRVNKAKVDVGQSPPLDLVSAQAEVAADQEQLIIAQTAVKQAEDALRLLIFDPADKDMWTTKIDPADAPPIATVTPDLDAAIANALRDRADLVRARKDIDSAHVNVKWTGAQRLPDVRLNASYLASGLGGTSLIPSAGFPPKIIGTGPVTPYGEVFNQLFTNLYPTWTAGVSINYPIGLSTERANYARAQLQEQQSAQRLKSLEAHVVQQLRDAAWKIDMNRQRIDTTRAARTLAEQRLDAERKRFDVGMSTSFLVIQAQRDLAQAKTNEVGAVLAYDLALVDFEALQLAGPAGAAGASAGAVAATGGAVTVSSAQAATATQPTASATTIPGVQR